MGAPGAPGMAEPGGLTWRNRRSAAADVGVNRLPFVGCVRARRFRTSRAAAPGLHARTAEDPAGTGSHRARPARADAKRTGPIQGIPVAQLPSRRRASARWLGVSRHLLSRLLDRGWRQRGNIPRSSEVLSRRRHRRGCGSLAPARSDRHRPGAWCRGW